MEHRRPRCPDARGVVIIVAVLVTMAGCGYRRPPLVRVEGVVTLDGAPVAEADVTLVPVGRGRAARGLASETGRVTFSTYAFGDGVIPGTYKVIVSKQELTKRGTRKMEALRSAQSPADETASEVMIEFTDGDYRNLLPSKYAGFDSTDLSVTIERGTKSIPLALTSAPSGEAR
jgi:hypothetical protein